MAAKKYFTGLEGFVWFVGVVEDRQDPEKMGRVRVRCFGWHTEDKKKIPTENLPWAHPMVSVNNPTAYAPKEGDMVMGFFMDGMAAQNPVVMGTFPGKPEKKPDYNIGFSDSWGSGNRAFANRPKKPDDSAEPYPKSKYLKEPTTSRLSREKTDSTVVATRKKNLKKGIKSAGGVSWAEPPPAYAAKYPYNLALESESGHAFELDDTPSAERVALSHRNGSFIEIDAKGNRVDRVQKDNYAVIMGDDFIYISGKAAITVDGNFNLKTSTINIEAAAINMASDGDIKIKGKAVKIEATGSMDLKAGGAGKFTAGGRLDLKGATAGLGGATVDIPAAKVNLQSGSVGAASGTGLKGGGTAPTAEETAEAANTSTAANTAVSEAAANSVASTANANGTPATTTTSRTPAANTANTTVAKSKDGITSTITETFKTVGDALTGVIKDFTSSGIGELVNKVADVEYLVNSTKGDILSLKDSLKNNLLTKIDTVSTLSAQNSIDFNPDQSLVDEIDKLKNGGVKTITTIVGKHLYPKTVSYNVVTTANTTGEG